MPPTPAHLPLIVRLRNWVGDVTLSVAALRRLEAAGYALQLVGKGWAARLLAGEGWTVHALPRGLKARVALYRRLRAEALQRDPGFDRRVNTVVLPTSFSSALEIRLAGLRGLGYAREGRSLLLSKAPRKPSGQHEMQHDWHLAQTLLGLAEPLPPYAVLSPSEDARQRVQALLVAQGLARPFVVLCPFAGGTFEKVDKRWPHFAEFTRVAAAEWGLPLVLCPGPGEGDVARRDFPQAVVLDGVGLDDYAALLERCALMVSNDTGPGHVAAAVGAPLLSVLGPTDPAQWGARGPGVKVLRGAPGAVVADPPVVWPDVAQAIEAGRAMLASISRSTSAAPGVRGSSA
ncbi:glycosyltransferase family 9 protein [Leptothrix sp. BB-4]